ncbi:helix-turn-helix domain-containing protein [Streptomyces sp. NPDC056231]|uniref:helix-turn-helix domain-containing protein n=1 Tax=Streptomyces sp. NPDC056231 TaxID=3345755 RepID=UPI003AAB157B
MTPGTVAHAGTLRSQGSDERVHRVRSANSRAHRNAPLTPEGRLRLCLRIDAGRPIAHVAAEAGLSRRRLPKWYARWRAHGENGLLDHSSRPATSPGRTAEDIAGLVEALWRQTKQGPAPLAADLQRLHGVTIAPVIVHRILVRRGLNRLRDLDPPTGEQLRKVIRYEHDRVGDLIHVDIKKLGRIPAGGGAGACTASAPTQPVPPSAPVRTPGRSATPISTRRSTITPAWPTPRPWRTSAPSRRPPSGTVRSRSSPPTTSSRSIAG